MSDPSDLMDPGTLADALRQIATAIGTPAHINLLADLPGLVLMVQGVVQRAESSAIVVADAVAAERMAIGTWLRARTMVDAPLARAIEHGDHIDDDAPPLPSLRMTLLLRDELHRQIKALEAERDHWRSVAKGRCERIDELHAELDKRTAPHCQHAGDPGHDMGHGVHPDRGGPSVMDAEIERLTVERDRWRGRAVMDGWLGLWVMKNGMPNDSRKPYREWMASGERARLLAHIGPDALAEVER